MRLLFSLLVASIVASVPAAAQQAPDAAPAPATVPPATPAPQPILEHRGLYETGFEVSWFHPCGGKFGDNVWWVTLTDDALKQRDSLAAKLTPGQGAVYARFKGTVSTRMPSGHGGRGSRYMLVTEVLELRPSSEYSCASA